jgi:hypothetical protein
VTKPQRTYGEPYIANPLARPRQIKRRRGHIAATLPVDASGHNAPSPD